MTGTPAACTVLAAELQRLRARHDLSLAALAERTPFSKSSWGRYLGGKALPPWQAVQHLCALVGEPEERFRALWTVAEAAWNQRDAVSAPERSAAEPPPASEPAARHVASTAPAASSASSVAAVSAGSIEPVATDVLEHGPQRGPGKRALLALLGVLALLAAVGVVVWQGLGAGRRGPVAAASATASDGAAGAVGCVGRACDGGDPTAMNCGVNPLSLGIFRLSQGAEVEIRWNAQCGAAWARVWSSQAGDRLSIAAGSDVQSRVVPDPYTAQTFFYTFMVPVVPGGPALRACLTFTDKQSQCVSVPEP
ncbi:helix-turn-helix domain-containing protein [Streptacidiphilus anmyonensis]|uniref:helix-turn-helix domain-containing protein n=1 Tax=Streptacidiphilus anmyonensis TaxID=405782 RepID=UPI0005A5D901|nr:XRE family transcriptional regulator [Streptacidiphilus anmyonensis]